MIDRAEKFAKFLRLGWTASSESGNRIFDFLYNASLEAGRDDLILDLGAGQCRYSFFFDHASYIGIDFGLGDQNWNYSKLDVLGDITRPDFIRDNSADFCLNTVTLEHLNEPQQFINHVHRILKPGGKLFLYVPCVAEEHQTPYDFFRYTSYGLRHLAAQFAKVDVSPSNNPLHTIAGYLKLTLDFYVPPPDNPELLARYASLYDLSEKVVRPLLDDLSRQGGSQVAMPLCWLMTAVKAGEGRLADVEDQPTGKTEDRPAAEAGEGRLAAEICGRDAASHKKRLLGKILCCPDCGASLMLQKTQAVCFGCKKKFPSRNGIVSFM